MSNINDGCHLALKASNYVIFGEASTRRNELADALSMKLSKDPDNIILITNTTVWDDEPDLYKDKIIILEDLDWRTKNFTFRQLIYNGHCWGITLILLVLPGMRLAPEIRCNMNVIFIDRSCISKSNTLYTDWGGLCVSHRSFRHIIKSLEVDEYLCIKSESLNITDITLIMNEINQETLMNTVDDTLHKLTTIIDQLIELRNDLKIK
jgi:hypothetical protein